MEYLWRAEARSQWFVLEKWPYWFSGCTRIAARGAVVLTGDDAAVERVWNGFITRFVFSERAMANVAKIVQENELLSRLVASPPMPVVFAGPVDPALLCSACGKVPVGAVVKAARLLCSSCTTTPLLCSPAPLAVLRALEALPVHCPLMCGTLMTRAETEAHLATQCPHCPGEAVQLHCPLCNCTYAGSRETALLHSALCGQLAGSSAWREERGDFGLIGRDCLERIMFFLEPRDVLALARCNRWLSQTVVRNWSHLKCVHCRLNHKEVLSFHPGRWGGLSFFDVEHRRKSTLSLSDTYKVASTASRNALLAGALSTFTLMSALVIIVPMLALSVASRQMQLVHGVLAGTGRGFGTIVGGTYRSLSQRLKPEGLTAWSCCERVGAAAPPCKQCYLTHMEDLAAPPTPEELEKMAADEAAAAAAAADAGDADAN